MTNDVRTDGLLTGWTICSVWLLSEFLQREKIKYLLFGAFATGLALLAKGPIALITIGIAIGSNLIFKKQFSKIFSFKWVLFFIVVAIVLLPMCYGLYLQYDLHPEKIVYGLQGPSGIKFFFWTQSFGRITGDIYWNNNTPFYYFCHTILWDYQPWILLLIGALIYLIKKLISNKFKQMMLPEYASLFVFILVFLMLSTSKYKLPHYIFITFPFASILVASYLSNVSEKTLKLFSRIQIVIIQLFFAVLFVNFVFFFPPSTFVLPIICFLLLILIWYLFFKLNKII